MPFLIALIGAAGAIYFFVMRARNAADMATDLMDVANDVRLAARRFGFTRRHDQHPVDSIEDPNIAIATLATAFIELDDMPTREQRDLLNVHLRSTLRISSEESQELQVLGRWLMNECNGPQPAITRSARKLFKLSAGDGFEPLMQIIGQLAPQSGLSDRQRDALNDIKTAFRIT